MIQREVKDPLTEEVLFGRLEKGGRVVVVLKPGKDDEGPGFGFEFDREDEPALV